MNRHGSIGAKLTIICVLTVALAYFCGCSSKSVLEEGGSSGSSEFTLTVSMTQTSVQVGETVLIEAEVMMGTTPVPDASVSFVVTPDSAGAFSASTGTTDSDGSLTTIYNATYAGAVTIHVAVESGANTASKNTVLTVGETSTDPVGYGFVGISVNPGLILANGTDIATVTIAVCDPFSQPAEDGTEITIVAGEKFDDLDGNGVWSRCCDVLLDDANGNGVWDSIGTIQSSAVTAGGIGEAIVEYTAGEAVGIVYIRATVNDNGIQKSAEYALQLSTTTAGEGLVGISVSPSIVYANSIDISTITVTVCDGNGDLAPDGTPVLVVVGERFIDGNGDGVWSPCCDTVVVDNNSNGTWDAMGSVSPVSGLVAGGAGQAVFEYTAGADTGTFYVRATVATEDIQAGAEFPLLLVPETGIGHVGVSAEPSLLVADGADTSVITVTVCDAYGDLAPDGTIVKLAAGEKFADNDGSGYWSPCCDEILEDANGNGAWDSRGTIAATAVVAGGAGQAMINYISGNDSGYVYIKATVEIDGVVSDADFAIMQMMPPEGPVSIDIWVENSLLMANGHDSSNVVITVRDAMGQRVEDGMLIIVVAGEKFMDLDSNGTFSQDVDELTFDANGNYKWDAMGAIPRYAVTSGGDGTAEMIYVSGTEAGTAFMKATVVDGKVGNATEVAVHLRPPETNIFSIYLISDSISLSVRHTGGIETSWLRAHCYDIYGNAVQEGLKVRFAILDGPNGSEFLGTDSTAPYVEITTNSQGVAATTIHSGIRSGTVRIRAYTDSVISNATQVVVAAGPPYHIWVGAEYCNTRWWDVVGEMATVVAVVADTFHNPVNDSTIVYFWTDEGSIRSHMERTWQGEGLAETRWISPGPLDAALYPPGGADGRIVIYAETAGGTVWDSTVFFNTYYTDTLIVTGMPTSLTADGFSKATVLVTGLDFNSNPVYGGTLFEGDANYIDVAGGNLQDGCYGATDRVKLTSSVLMADYSTDGVSNDDGIGGIDNVMFWTASGAVSIFQVSMLTSTAYSGNCMIVGGGSVMINQELEFYAIIKDRYGNPLGDHTLHMVATGGTVLSADKKSNAYGEAFGFEWQAPGTAGTYVVTIQDLDPRGGVNLVKTISVTD